MMVFHYFVFEPRANRWMTPHLKFKMLKPLKTVFDVHLICLFLSQWKADGSSYPTYEGTTCFGNQEVPRGELYYPSIPILIQSTGATFDSY